MKILGDRYYIYPPPWLQRYIGHPTNVYTRLRSAWRQFRNDPREHDWVKLPDTDVADGRIVSVSDDVPPRLRLNVPTWECTKCFSRLYGAEMKPTYLEHDDCDAAILGEVHNS